MNLQVLHSDVQNYIRSFEGDLTKLALSGSPFEKVSVQELIQQIEGLRKSKNKLPTWTTTPGIYFPPKLHLEQTSSEVTAAYKATLVSGASCIDVTGGFGIDAYYFSEVFEKVRHCEMNKNLHEIVVYNSTLLTRNNISFSCGDGIETALSTFHDVIYIDPSRRHQTKGKVFYLRDCEPNLPKHLNALMSCCQTLLVKTSPMLDLTVGMQELQGVSEIHIVAVDNEVKELLWIINKDVTTPPKVLTVNFVQGALQEFNFTFGSSKTLDYAAPSSFLYEPNAAILKSGAFTLLPDRYKVSKIAQHTHLYTSESLVEFPGRRFKIDEIIPYRKKDMNTHVSGLKANVSTRNFPITVSNLRKKWKLRDGGTVYLFFVTLEDGQRVVLKCSKHRS